MKLTLQLIKWAVDMKLMIQWAVTSAVLILIVLAVRYVLRDKLSARLRYALWGVVLLRLLIPFQIELPAAAPLPVLASNLAQDVTPRLDDTMLYAIPTEDQPTDKAPVGKPPQYVRNGICNDWEYYSGGVVYDGGRVTRYAFMMTALEVVVLIWVAGTALAALVILVSNLRFFIRLEERRKPLDIPDSTVPVYVAEGLPSPCLFGVFRPAVYVTPQAAEDPDTLRHVLAHELTHYKHKDHIWSALRCAALALHWYDPLVWLAVVLSKRDGELACDEGAVARLGEAERIPYGRTLVDMVAARSLRPGDLLSCSTAMTGGKKSIQQRVAALVKKPETVKAALFAAIALVALSAVFVFAERGPAQRENEMFLDQLDRATAIRYIPPAYSSRIYIDPIQKEDLLAEAKEALSNFRYLKADDPQPDLSTKELLREHRIILTFEGFEDGGPNYSLLWQNDYTYLFPGSVLAEGVVLKEREGETAQLQGVSGTCISQRGDNVIATLERLAGGQSRLYMDPMPMTREELEDWTRALIGHDKLQLQGRPEDSGDAEFHAGYVSVEKGTTDLWYYGDDTHAGVWVLSLKTPSLDSNHGYNGFPVTSDLPMVVYNAARYAGEEETSYEQLGPGAFAASLRPEDVIGSYPSQHDGAPLYGASITISVEKIKELAIQGLYHQFSAEYDKEKYGQYCLTIQVEKDVGYYLKDGGRDGLILSIGSEPDVVCLRHRILASPENMTHQYIRSPELYELLREAAEGTAALRGNLTPEQVAQVNEAFRSDVLLPDGSYGPSEISCFFTSSYDDPTQIDLEEFLRYCPIGEVLGDGDVEEFRAVMEKAEPEEPDRYQTPRDYPTPVHRYPREKVSALLQKYTGVTVDQLDWGDMLYVEKYDAFYNFTSDYGPGFFPCAGGQIMEDAVWLWSGPEREDDRCELVLLKSGDRWLIQSHHTIYER